MKVMLDTNVLDSAVATRGLCADVLRAVLAEHELAICPQIISELQRVLKNKFALPRPLANDFIRLVREDAVLCEPGDLPAVKLKDKDDLGILSAAISGEVNVIVTGDKDLQMVDTVAKLKIMSPRQFWKELTEESD
jgi:putative PIN family toxin of toxin-antitoxin system